MKKILFVSFLLIVAFFASCTKGEVLSKEKQLTRSEVVAQDYQNRSLYYSQSSLARLISDKVTIACSGTCGCKVERTVSQDTWTSSCSCADCVMGITFSRKQLNLSETIDKKKVLESLLRLPFYGEALSDITSYIKDYYKIEKVHFDEIEFEIKEDVMVILFYFTDEDGLAQSVLYANNNLITNKKIRIDCHGSCGCKEQYDLLKGVASCSSDDCVMDISVLP